MLDSRHTYANRWITYKKNQRLLTSLGIINENPEPFVNNYRQVLRGITEGEIQTIIKDQIQNYEEVFADYGMCKAFSFTAYGYFMYLIHIFMKERDVPKSGLKDLSADRIYLITPVWPTPFLFTDLCSDVTKVTSDFYC